MKNPANEKYVRLGVTLGIVCVLGLLVTFMFLKWGVIADAWAVLCGIIAPFVWGFVIAYLLAPLCNRFEKLFLHIKDKNGNPRVGLAKGLSIVLSLLAAFLVIVAILILVIPEVFSNIVHLVEQVRVQLEALYASAHDLLNENPEIQEYWDQILGLAISDIESLFGGDTFSNVQKVLGVIGGGVGSFVDTVGNLFFGILLSIYMLASRHKFAEQAKLCLHSIAPGKLADSIEGEVRFADKMFNGFLVGRILVSCVIGVLCFAGCTLLRIDNAAFISVIVLLFNIIPFFGPIMAAVVCGLLLLIQNPIHCVYFLIFFVILQQVDGNILGPKIIGDATGLSGFWVLFSILFFGGLWGVVGMVVGIPLFAVIYDIISKFVRWSLHKQKRDDLMSAYRDKYPQEGGQAELPAAPAPEAAAEQAPAPEAAAEQAPAPEAAAPEDPAPEDR